MPAPLEAVWYEVWPEVCRPSVLAPLAAEQLATISLIMRKKAQACGKPALQRMGYSFYPETRGWADLTMPLEAWQADCLFCEFMPPKDRKEAWLSGSNRVRAVE
eukprot:3867464-Amphidinium_carterae.1